MITKDAIETLLKTWARGVSAADEEVIVAVANSAILRNYAFRAVEQIFEHEDHGCQQFNMEVAHLVSTCVCIGYRLALQYPPKEVIN